MPYEKTSSCKTPEDLTQKIWRYMDFTKFVAMLEDKTLFFPNLTSLSDDPLEGFLTKPNVEQFRKVPDGTDSMEAERKRTTGQIILDMMKNGRKLLYVSSWHMGNHESAAMWKLYLKSGEGVAIQSTVGRLIESLKKVQYKVFVGMVEYVDYEKYELPHPSLLSAAMLKRKSFEHEKELRAITTDSRNIDGLSLPVDIDVLIEKVFVAPIAPKWIHDLFIKVVARYTLNKEVEKSTLEQGPLY